MSSAGKRPGSPSVSTQRAAKRGALAPATRDEPIVISDDEDDSVEIVLARIKEQEQSEALAKQLQDEWRREVLTNNLNLPIASSSRTQDDDVIMIDSGTEDDEAMARRLAKEWAQTGSSSPSRSQETSKKQPCITSKGNSKGKSPEKSSSVGQAHAPDEKLRECRGAFTADRECSKCGSLVQSPNGHVGCCNTARAMALTLFLRSCFQLVILPLALCIYCMLHAGIVVPTIAEAV
jgi:hypothetical protein